MEPLKAYLEPSSRSIGVLLRSLISRIVEIKTKITVAQMATANTVLPMLAPYHDQQDNGTSMHIHVATITKDKDQPAQVAMSSTPKELKQVSDKRLEKTFNKLDLNRIDEWEGEDQQQVRGFKAEYTHLFALDDLNLGKMSLVKYKIELTDNAPFKESYRWIPPQQYDEVKNIYKRC